MFHIRGLLEEKDNLSPEEMEGIIGYSPLMDYPGFDFINGIPCEYLHHICLGVAKKMIELTFNVGESRKRITKRKLSKPEEYNKIMNEVKVPSEFSRRGRNLDLKVMKGEEFRNLIIFFFPIVINCIEMSNGKQERILWLMFAYLIRAYVIPREEFYYVCREQVDFCREKFLVMYLQRNRFVAKW